MTIENILKELKYNTGIFPRESLIEAIENRELIIPELLEIIRFSTENIEELVDDERYFAHIHAMYLLAQFREPRAYRLLINLFSFPGRIPFDFTGDIVTTALSKILASVFDGDTDPLKTLIEDENINEYVRAAALEAFSILVATGKIPRDETIDYFKELFNGKIEREFSFVWNALVSESTGLYPEELYEEIKTAFDEDLVEAFFININHVEETLKKGKEYCLGELRRRWKNGLIDDAISEMEDWSCFKQPERNESKRNASVPYRRKSKKIGRNEPCPCGSGKKYKKCCLNS